MTASRSPTASPLRDLEALDQSVWLDNMRRALLSSGELERMVREDGLSGLTSNPSIFEKAIVGSTDYDDALAELRGPSAPDAKRVYEGLAIADLRAAADVFRRAYEDTDATDGYASMEVSPDLAHDTAGTVAKARRLWASVDRPNLMIKVPGTEEGVPAIRELIAAGINVNITCCSRPRCTSAWWRPIWRGWSSGWRTAGTSPGWRRWRASSSAESTRRSTRGSARTFRAGWGSPTRR